MRCSRHLDPAPAMFEAMVRGWDTQQRARHLTESTVRPRLRLMRRLVEFSNSVSVAVDAGGVRGLHRASAVGAAAVGAVDGARVRAVDPVVLVHHLLQRFGEAPQQVVHEDNSVLHVEDYEGGSVNAAFTTARDAPG